MKVTSLIALFLAVLAGCGNADRERQLSIEILELHAALSTAEAKVSKLETAIAMQPIEAAKPKNRPHLRTDVATARAAIEVEPAAKFIAQEEGVITRLESEPLKASASLWAWDETHLAQAVIAIDVGGLSDAAGEQRRMQAARWAKACSAHVGEKEVVEMMVDADMLKAGGSTAMRRFDTAQVEVFRIDDDITVVVRPSPED